MATLPFKDMIAAVERNRTQGLNLRNLSILVFDPGLTTGWCYFVNDELKEWGQLNTPDIGTATKVFMEMLDTSKRHIDYVIFEEYRVYKHKTEQHSNSDVPTLRIIGTIETICTMNGIIYTKQTAAIAKGFCTDANLKAWNFWIEGQRHARDAIRHACYFLLFGKLK